MDKNDQDAMYIRQGSTLAHPSLAMLLVVADMFGGVKMLKQLFDAYKVALYTLSVVVLHGSLHWSKTQLHLDHFYVIYKTTFNTGFSQSFKMVAIPITASRQ